MTLKLGFLATRNGASARAIFAAIREGRLDAEARVMISNRREAPALAFAAENGIPAICIPTKADPTAADLRLAETLREHGVDLVILSGYLRELGPEMLARYAGRIVNIHPSLLPAFGGYGMYGRRVHEAVIAEGAIESGATIHLVEGEYDTGPTLAQRAVALEPGETADSLEAKVKDLEPAFFVETLQKIAAGKIRLC